MAFCKWPQQKAPVPPAQLSPDGRCCWKNLGRPYRATHTRTLTHVQKYNPILSLLLEGTMSESCHLGTKVGLLIIQD